MAQIALIQSGDFFMEKSTMKQSMLAMHHHTTHELYFLIKGEREYFIEDQFFKIGEGDLVLIPKQQLHRTGGKGATRFLIQFSDEFISRFFTPAATGDLLRGGPTVFRPDEALRDRLGVIFNTLYTEYHKVGGATGGDSDAMLAGYLYEILFAMRFAGNGYTKEAYADTRVAQVIKYINENYNHIADIEQIADHFFISKYHLCRIFNKNLGIPLITYLNTIKIREACAMMRRGHSNLTDVAMACGFNSSSYFCKVFKNEKGISPTEYKKQLKSQGK